jgi:hypothetical protein
MITVFERFPWRERYCWNQIRMRLNVAKWRFGFEMRCVSMVGRETKPDGETGYGKRGNKVVDAVIRAGLARDLSMGAA